MKAGLTVDDLIAAYGPTIRSLPSNKPRDPVERALLQRLGDPNVGREVDGLTRIAGERPTQQKTEKAR
jgi:hypothetical protein